MKKNRVITGMLAAGLLVVVSGCGSSKASEEVDLNSMKLEDIVEKAKEDGKIESVGMPDSWANWVGTWSDIKDKYGIDHTDTDMSSGEELALFESEGTNATKDIGDVGQSFGPVAMEKGLTLPYKPSTWDSIPDWAKDPDGNWVIGYYGTISFITNKSLVKNPPKSFADILKGDYKVSVGDVKVATQAQNGVLAAAIANGGDESNIQSGLDYFKTLAEQGRIDKGEFSLARMEKGEIEVAILWDYNALGYRSQIMANNPSADFEVSIPSDGTTQSGYATIINKFTKRPYAAALAREYILSDEGQINLAKGFAKPIRSDVVLPEEVKKTLLPDEQYKNASIIKDQKAWEKTSKTIGTKWQEEVMAFAK